MASKFDHFPSDTARQSYSRFRFPKLIRASRGPADSTVVAEFTKPLDPVSASDTASYSLNNDGLIKYAMLDPEDSSRVILGVENMVKGQEYTLSVNNVQDFQGMFIPFNSKASFIYSYILEITASDASEEHLPEHSMDGDMTSYWSAIGTSGVWIQYDLRTLRFVQSLEIAFLFGDQRKSYFSIETSVDGIQWTEAYRGESSGNNLDLEVFDLEDAWVRYVRILGLGNSSTNDWNSYTEVQINWLLATNLSTCSMEDGLKIYPQPAVNGIYVELAGWEGETDLLLVNVLGQINRYRLSSASTWIPTRHLSSGVYLVMVPAEGRMLSRRLLVMNKR
jgi:hypothetical protein